MGKFILSVCVDDCPKERSGIPSSCLPSLGSAPGFRKLAQAALWIGAGLLAFSAHAAAMAWVLHQPPLEMADNAAPPAIMIELAKEPEAINTDENNITPDEQSADVSEASVDKPVEQLTPQDDLEPVPVPEEVVETPPVEQPELRDAAVLENVPVPIPLTPPPPVEKQKPEEKPRKVEKKTAVRQTASVSSQAKVTASAQISQSSRNAASQSVAGMGFGSVSPAKWQSRLMAHLERRKKYPAGAKSRREQGTVFVRFSIDDGGNVLSANLARSSGFSELDAEVLALVRRASPVPVPPPGLNRTITAPVKFSVR